MMESPRAASSSVISPTEIVCEGETLQLLPEKAVYWKREGIILVADVHLGKAAAFQSAGLAVPGGEGVEDLARLGRVVDSTGAREVIVLGDLLHARSGRTRVVREAFAAWRAARVSLRVTLVMGNHDESAGAPPEEWGIEVWPESLWRGPFRLIHEAGPGGDGYSLGGHVHPAVSVSEGRRGGFRMPCFLFAGTHAILPAFGSFTGTRVIDADTVGRVFGIAEGRIFEIPEGLRAGSARARNRGGNAWAAQKSGESEPPFR